MHYPAVDLRKKKSEALVVHCSDPRFQSIYRQFIDNVGVYYDLMVLPGASLAVVENQKAVEDIKLLHQLHHFEAVHILDHTHCGAFGDVTDERQAHSEKLTLAEKKLKTALPGLLVYTYLLGDKTEIKLATP